MTSYGQYCPIARGAEILGERWTPLIIRDMMFGACRFNDIERGLPGISRSLLAGRLRRLMRAGVIEQRPSPQGHVEYRLTPAGEELSRIVYGLGQWATRWIFGDPNPEERDPMLLLWWMHGRINQDLLPPQRVVVRFDFRGASRRYMWLVLGRHDVSVCLDDPGFDTNLIVTADIAALYRVWLGRTRLADALEERTIEIEGPQSLVRAFPRWLQWSPIADDVRAAAFRPAKQSAGAYSPANRSGGASPRAAGPQAPTRGGRQRRRRSRSVVIPGPPAPG